MLSLFWGHTAFARWLNEAASFEPLSRLCLCILEDTTPTTTTWHSSFRIHSNTHHVQILLLNSATAAEKTVRQLPPSATHSLLFRDFTHKLSAPRKHSGWIIQHGYRDILRSQDKAIQPEFILFTKASSSPSSSQPREVCPPAAHLLLFMQNSPYLFSSKAWQAQRQNSLCLFARLSLPLRPQKPRNITMFLRLVLRHRCINRAHLPEGGFKWNSSCNSFLSTEQLTTAEHPHSVP